jgi:anion-transporting  ArsA/GET3 family ATPase
MPRPTLAPLISQRRIVVCAGAGGVGKTTTAAALAMAAARRGRNTLVLTIDPAKRLAEALGLGGALGHDIRLVPPERVGGPGRLYAMMLDQKRAFDEIVERYATDEGTRRRIFENRIYQQISTTLAGSHEYAAMAKLYELNSESRYDLIVLDTPPTANALDFLEAPDRLTAAIDSPAIDWLIRPYVEAGRFSLKTLGRGAAFILGRIARFVGSQFLEEMAHFFVEFNQVLGGFRQRAREVFDVLRRPDVGFVLVTSPEPLAVDEVLFFHAQLSTYRMPLGGFIVNRVHPCGPDALGRAALIAKLTSCPELRGYSHDDILQVAADFSRAYKEQQTLAAHDARQIERLRSHATRTPIVEVPLFDRDVYDPSELSEMIDHLCG